MNIFRGCDPETMDELAEKFVEYAEHLRDLIDLLSTTSTTITWTGADADSYRRRFSAVALGATDIRRALEDRAVQLQEESVQQVFASRADGTWADPLRAVRAELPGLGKSDGEGVNIPRLRRRRGFEDLGPMIGGPFMKEDPLRWGGSRPALPDLGDLGPWIGGPLAKQPAQPDSPREPLPEGEEFALDPERLEHAEEVRRTGFDTYKWAALGQGLMDAHAGIGEGLDIAESALEAHGLGALTPAVSAARIPHAAASIAIGENSTMGQVTTEVEHLMANLDQTGHEVTDALGRGDLAAAARAGERGMYRHYEGLAGIVTANAFPATIHAAEDAAGHAADVVEPVSPEAAAVLRGWEETSRGISRQGEDTWNQLTDSENWYDARRRALPLPWDPRS